MQLKVANEEIVTLAHVADMTCEVVVQEDALRLVLRTNLIIDQVTLGQRVIMVECVDTLYLSVAIVHILLHIEAVHVDESWRLTLLEQLLLERVAVLSIIDDDFAISSADKPFVIRFEEADVEAVQGCVQRYQVLDRNCKRPPDLHVDQ